MVTIISSCGIAAAQSSGESAVAAPGSFRMPGEAFMFNDHVEPSRTPDPNFFYFVLVFIAVMIAGAVAIAYMFV
jgi:hypothetical protein